MDDEQGKAAMEAEAGAYEADQAAQDEAEAARETEHEPALTIDTKYEFLAWKRGRHGEDEPITENDGIVFRAKDNALVSTLMFYIQECERLGASHEQLMGIVALIDRVKKWREKNAHLCKVPD